MERLRPGDRLLTLDNGLVPMLWLGAAALSPLQLAMKPELAPILIRKGALGDGLPAADLYLSPQHRLLVRSKIALRMFGAQEVIVPVKKLLSLPGVEQRPNYQGADYFHILCEGHQLIWAEGAPVETLYLGAQARKSLSPAALQEIHALLPEVKSLAQDQALGQPIRPIIQGKEATRLAERHVKNNKPLADIARVGC